MELCLGRPPIASEETVIRDCFYTLRARKSPENRARISDRRRRAPETGSRTPEHAYLPIWVGFYLDVLWRNYRQGHCLIDYATRPGALVRAPIRRAIEPSSHARRVVRKEQEERSDSVFASCCLGEERMCSAVCSGQNGQKRWGPETTGSRK
jgi:hypothetical protein